MSKRKAAAVDEDNALVVAVTEEVPSFHDVAWKRSLFAGLGDGPDMEMAEHIAVKYGDGYFRRAYRMSFPQFTRLCALLKPGMTKNQIKCQRRRVSHSARVSAALRYCAGGNEQEITLYHKMRSRKEFDTCIWDFVDAVNACTELAILYPTSHETQESIAQEFAKASPAGFDTCAGCMDGMLIWTEKPTQQECADTHAGSAAFFCERKKKFGINMQGICDSRHRFLNISILHPGAMCDYLGYVRSTFYGKCKDTVNPLLKPGLVIFGDNAYVSSDFVVVPYTSGASKNKDDFNHYHSQIRIAIERAFGMLVNRWAILRRPLPAALGVKKQLALTMALCKLHNYCIGPDDDTENNNMSSSTIASSLPEDERRVLDAGGIRVHADGRTPELLDGGHHFDDMCVDDCINEQPNTAKPRSALRKLLKSKGLHRTV